MKGAAAALAALTILRLAVAASVPLAPDEAYYWIWSRALAAGYVDHPPMVALWIRAGTLLAGQTPLGVRLLGPIAAALGTILLADAAEHLLPGRRAGLIAGTAWNATLLVGAGSVIMTPDAPLLFFWCSALWAMARLVAGGGGAWWLAAGGFAGTALASKYTALFLWGGIGLWTLLVPTGRQWLRRPWPWLGLLLGFCVFLPVLVWNADHAWVSFVRQGGRVEDWQPRRAIGFLAELLGGQVGLLTPGIWLLAAAGMVLAVRRLWRDRDAGMALLSMLSVPALLVFIQHAVGDRVQGNWPAIIYPAAVIAVAGLTAPAWLRLFWPSAWVGFALTFLVLVHAVFGVLPLPARLDPVAVRLAGWDGLAAQVEEARVAAGATYVVGEQYALIAELAWNAAPDMQVAGIEPRFAPMDLPRENLAGRRGLLVRPEHRGDAIDPAIWPLAVPLGFVERQTPRGPIERYRLWQVTGPVMATVLPRN